MCLRGRVCACAGRSVLRGPRGLESLELGLQAVVRGLMWELEATRNWVWFLCESSVGFHPPTHLPSPSRKFCDSLPLCVSVWERCPISSHPWLILSVSGSRDSKQRDKANLVKSRERLAQRWLCLAEQILFSSPPAKAGSALRSSVTQRQNSQRNDGHG